MDYKLVKQLKDAGFPMPKPQPYQNAADENTIITPSLSELIKACGDEFEELSLLRPEMIVEEEGGFKWSARGNYGDSVFGMGDDPETAVAKLWLKLNKK